MKAEYSRRFDSFVKIWDKAVKKNDKRAQFELASFYMRLNNEGADKKAFDLYKKSAKQGFANAIYAVGKCYETGRGIRKNYYQAVQWYIRTDQNVTDYVMNHRDSEGEAVSAQFKRYFEDEEYARFIDELVDADETDEEEAFAADRDAALSGDAQAQNRLGHRYFYGNGTPEDIVHALFWFKKSAENDCEAGMLNLARYYEEEKRYKEAAKWYGKYAEKRIQWRNERLGGEV